MAKTTKKTAGDALHHLFHEIFQLQAALSSIMDAVHAQAGLTTPQLRIMEAIREIGPATVPDIAAQLGVSRQFVQTVCNDLLTYGFLQFFDNPRHKRSKLTALTELGRSAYQKARQKEYEIIEKTLPEIDPGKVAEVSDLLGFIRKAVPKKILKL